MADDAALTPEARRLLLRRIAALNDGDLALRDWDMTFIQSICWKQPETLSPRQREMVELLCWRYRDKIAPDLAPSSEPRLTPRPERRWADQPVPPRRRQRGISA
jgi:hypothetical protein